ncbi:hypothetical protein SK128_011585 [Halocaridina rubra]|uniref:Uncharacterized protein n=1 Tax=Halocaridina rubra TaxID=373956 RepID=A0AAN8WEK2_HALRR
MSLMDSLTYSKTLVTRAASAAVSCFLIGSCALPVSSQYRSFIGVSISGLGPLIPWIPSIIFGGASLSAGFITLFLPETLGKPLPDTINDIEYTKTMSKRNTSAAEGDAEEMNKLDM